MVSKRQLGIGFILFGLVLAIAIFTIDWLGAGNYGGIGPMQRFGLIGTLIIILAGFTLLPLGDRPA